MGEPPSDSRGREASGARLGPGVDLRGADLRGVDLRGADLRGVDLREADLRGADLRDADLRGAQLADEVGFNELDLPRRSAQADLRGARLDGARLDGAVGRPRLGPLDAEPSSEVAPAPDRAPGASRRRANAAPSPGAGAAPAGAPRRRRRRPAAPGASSAPPPGDPRARWLALALRVAASAPELAPLGPALQAAAWDEASDPSTLTRHERREARHGAWSLAVEATVHHADTSAGPVEVERNWRLALHEAGAPRVVVVGVGAGPAQLVLGPSGLAAQLGLAPGGDGAAG